MKYVFVLLNILFSATILFSQSYEDGMIFYRKGFNKDVSEEERKANLEKALNIFRKVSMNEDWTQNGYDSRIRIAAIHNVIGSNRKEEKKYKKSIQKLDNPSVKKEPLILCSQAADLLIIQKTHEYTISYLGLQNPQKASEHILKRGNYLSANDNAYWDLGIQVDVLPYIEIIRLVKTKEELKEELNQSIEKIKNKIDFQESIYGETTFFDHTIYVYSPNFEKEKDLSFNHTSEAQKYVKQLFLESKFVKELQAYL